MADLPPQSLVATESQTELPVPDKDTASYRYAKALAETARAVASERIKTFKKNWDFFLGREQWQLAGSTSAAQLDQWAFRGVVNWCFATIKTKSAIVTGAPSEIFCDPLDDQSSYMDRLLVKSVIEDDLARLNFRDVKRDAYLSGSVTGVGIAMLSAKPDPLTGSMATVLTPIKSDELFIDPSSDSPRSPNCRFVVWEPELDMSTVRDMWPSKAPLVKPEIRQVTGGFTYRSDRTADNLIYGKAGEFVVDQANMLRSRKAKVCFVWIKDESIIEDLHEVIIKDPKPGYKCVSCDIAHAEDSVYGGLNAGSPCPMCGGDMEPYEIPAEKEQSRVVRREYPYGRLIVYSGETLLYDGENPYEIETVFPFAVYMHDRVPGDFYGTNDVVLLESLQDAQNRTVGQLIDYVRLAVNGPFEYAMGCKSYTEMGNGPAERHPVPDHLFGKARFVTPDGFNVQAWGALHSSLEHHFQVVSGLGSIGMGQTSSPPISATEAELANARLSDRMKGHANEFSTFCSEIASLDYQLLKQFSRDPRNVSVNMPDSTIKAIEVEVQKLPKVNVRIVIDTELSAKDKLLGQNLAGFAQSGGMDSPYADIILGKFGFSDAEIKEFMARRGLNQELMPPGAPMGQQPETPQPQGAPIA